MSWRIAVTARKGATNADCRSFAGKMSLPRSAKRHGLLATFFENIQLDGKVLERKVAIPRFDQFVPAGRREQWSARYEGDLNLPQAGNGRSPVCPMTACAFISRASRSCRRKAWSPHPATPYKTDRTLAGLAPDYD